MLYHSLLFVHSPELATPELCTLSLHDALPIFTGNQRDFVSLHRAAAAVADGGERLQRQCAGVGIVTACVAGMPGDAGDRKSTRLNSSHVAISYAVFCLNKKKL